MVFVTVGRAARLVEVDERTIYRWLASRRITGWKGPGPRGVWRLPLGEDGLPLVAAQVRRRALR